MAPVAVGGEDGLVVRPAVTVVVWHADPLVVAGAGAVEADMMISPVYNRNTSCSRARIHGGSRSYSSTVRDQQHAVSLSRSRRGFEGFRSLSSLPGAYTPRWCR